MSRRIALITTVLALALAAPAAAQDDPFGPLPAAPTATPAAVATATVDDGTTGRDVLFVVLGLLVAGFGVMGYFILRDARHSLPESELAGVGRLRDEGPHKHAKQAKAKARARTRAQKQARKAHRKR